MVKLHIHRERSIESLLREHSGIILKVCAMYCRRSSGPRGGAMCEAVPPLVSNTSGTRRGNEWREEVSDLFHGVEFDCDSNLIFLSISSGRPTEKSIPRD